jgi:hypothetical protein
MSNKLILKSFAVMTLLFIFQSCEREISDDAILATYPKTAEVFNDNLAQCYDVSGNSNIMLLKEIRPAAVYFDSSVHLAIRVDLTA